MGRSVTEGKSYRGLTVHGAGDQPYFAKCDFTKAIFTGDWSGADFFDCVFDGADLTQADTYAAYWRGGTYAGCQFPSSIGWLHHHPVAEIIRQRTTQAVEGLSPKDQACCAQAAEIACQCVEGGYRTGSWIPSYAKIRETTSQEDFERCVTPFVRTTFSSYPRLAQRFESLFHLAFKLGKTDFTPAETIQTVTWPDGIAVTINADDLSRVETPQGRYELARWIEAQAGEGRYCFVCSIEHLVINLMPEPTTWRLARWGGY